MVSGVQYSERKFYVHNDIDYAVRTNNPEQKVSIFVIGKNSNSTAPTSAGEDDVSIASGNIWKDKKISTKVNKNASTSNVQKVVPVFMNKDGDIAAQKKLEDDFSGVLEFDMYGADETIITKDTLSTVTTLNRNSKESRDKFDELITNSHNVSGLSHSEILALNHLAGNVYVLNNGNKNVFYRQPTEEEVNDGRKDWIEVTNPTEIEIRQTALTILQGKNPLQVNDDNDNDTETNSSSSNEHQQMTVLHPMFDFSQSNSTDERLAAQIIKNLFSSGSTTKAVNTCDPLTTRDSKQQNKVELEILKIGVQWVLVQDNWDQGQQKLLKTYFNDVKQSEEKIKEKLNKDDFLVTDSETIAKNILGLFNF